MILKKDFFAHRWITASVGVVVGVGIGYAASFLNASTNLPPANQYELDSKYRLINPLLACGDDNFSRFSNGASSALEEKIRSFLTSQESAGTLSNGAVYFRELNGGPWFGINAGEMFTPGSLLKVPLVMSVYLKSESVPTLLKDSVLYEGGTAPATEHFTSATIDEGGTYSVEDLAKATLINSDNNAALLLAQLISQNELNASYAQLGIQTPTSGQDYTMSVRTYASFFRILFNATYLNHDDSEHLLDLLSQTTFTQGLVAGVPSGVTVAHKFGERAYQEAGGASTVQLHDCGIVYKPDHPYLICVMMRGNDYDALSKDIQAISALVYKNAE